MIKIFGHRGAILHTPGTPYQNSLKAFALAFTHADGLETDGCETADGHIYLIHGVDCAEHLDSASQQALGTHRLDQLPDDQARHLKLADGQPLPRLEALLELLARHPGKTLNLELKGPHVARYVVPVLQKAFRTTGVQPHQLIISSFNHGALTGLREALPGIRIGMLFDSPQNGETPMYPWLEGNTARYIPFSDAALSADTVRALAPDFIIIPHMAATAEALQLLHTHVPQARLMVWVYTEMGGFDPAAMSQFITTCGDVLYALIVDNPQAFPRPVAG